MPQDKAWVKKEEQVDVYCTPEPPSSRIAPISAKNLNCPPDPPAPAISARAAASPCVVNNALLLAATEGMMGTVAATCKPLSLSTSEKLSELHTVLMDMALNDAVQEGDETKHKGKMCEDMMCFPVAHCRYRHKEVVDFVLKSTVHASLSSQHISTV